jgi:hypothetical protein
MDAGYISSARLLYERAVGDIGFWLMLGPEQPDVPDGQT